MIMTVVTGGKNLKTNVPSNILLPIGSSNWAASNQYDFIGFVNVKAGANTIVLTVTDTGNHSGSDTNGYNVYAIRFTAADNTFTV